MAADAVGPRELLRFWLELPEKTLFTADPAFDRELASRFGKTLEEAEAGRLDHWTASAEGALALVVLLDQMSRNIHRGSPAMYANDAKALAAAKQAIARGDDLRMSKEERRWLYMPFMHSEDLADQERCVELFKSSGLESALPYAEEHADIVRRFGRFPHRNAILGRVSSAEEKAYLDEGGFKG